MSALVSISIVHSLAEYLILRTVRRVRWEDSSIYQRSKLARTRISNVSVWLHVPSVYKYERRFRDLLSHSIDSVSTPSRSQHLSNYPKRPFLPLPPSDEQKKSIGNRRRALVAASIIAGFGRGHSSCFPGTWVAAARGSPLLSGSGTLF